MRLPIGIMNQYVAPPPGGAPSIINSDQIHTGGTRSTSLGFPTNITPIAGNVVAHFIGDDNAQGSPKPWTISGDTTRTWTQFVNVGNSVSDCKLTGWWTVWASDGTLPTFDNGSNTDKWGAFIQLSGANTSNPIQSVGAATMAESASHVSAAVSATANEKVLIALAFDGGDPVYTAAPGTNFIQQVFAGTGGGHASGFIAESDSGASKTFTTDITDGSVIVPIVFQ